MAASDFSEAREAMVERHLEARGIKDARVLAAFRAVPREMFVAPKFAALAYGDHPLDIGFGQTISQPYIVALMAEAAEIGPDDRVLEVGAGSGYAAAILGHLARAVIAVERHAGLAGMARERLQALGLSNVDIRHGDGLEAAAGEGPFDAILAAAASRNVPSSLVEQLVPGGRLVIPVGGQAGVQDLLRITRLPEGGVARQSLCAVRFVPLVAGDPA